MATTAIAVTIIVTNQKKHTTIRGTITNVTDTTMSMKVTTTSMKGMTTSMKVMMGTTTKPKAEAS